MTAGGIIPLPEDRKTPATTMADPAAEALIVQAEDYAHAETIRAEKLAALANDILSRFIRTSDGYRARVGQVQIKRWEADLLNLKDAAGEPDP